MEALLLSLLLWINQNSSFSYDVSRGLPEVTAADPAILAAYMVDDPTILAVDHKTPSLKSFINHIQAVYDPDRKTILINSKIDLESEYARSVIVHELVHFIQYQHHIDQQVECLNALEKDAYHIQGRYMDKHHIPKNFDPASVALRSICWSFEE